MPDTHTCLTAAQRAILAFLRDHIREQEFPGRLTLNTHGVRQLCDLFDAQAREIAALRDWVNQQTEMARLDACDTANSEVRTMAVQHLGVWQAVQDRLAYFLYGASGRTEDAQPTPQE